MKISVTIYYFLLQLKLITNAWRLKAEMYYTSLCN